MDSVPEPHSPSGPHLADVKRQLQMAEQERQLQTAQTAAAMARVTALQQELMMANDATSAPPSESLLADVAVQQSTSSMHNDPTEVPPLYQ